MASPSTADLTGLFMETYGDSLKDFMPKSLTLLPRIGFESKTRISSKFHVPVVVASEQGVTYAPAAAGAFTLADPVALNTQDAQVDAVNMVVAASIDYESAAKAAVSKSSFAELTALKVKHMTTTARKRLEISLWHGQNGLGTVEAATNPSDGHVRLTISAATWAPLVWAGMTGAHLDLYDGTTLQNDQADLVVEKVDIANRYVYCTSGTSDDSSIAGISFGGNEVLYFAKTTTYNSTTFASHNDMLGILKQLNTSGSVFNIDNSVYEQWAPNSYNASGAMTYAKTVAAVDLAVSRGLEEDVEVFMSYKTFNNVANDMAALRVIDQSYDPKKAIAGFESVQFHGLNGAIKLTPSGFCPGGTAVVLPVKDCIRVGATDLTFSTPGSKGGDIFFQLSTQAGFGLRAYQNQGVACLAPSRAVLVTGIVNT